MIENLFKEIIDESFQIMQRNVDIHIRGGPTISWKIHYKKAFTIAYSHQTV